MVPMRLAAPFLALAAAFAGAGCSNDPTIVTPRSLDHAGRIAFVCLDRAQFGVEGGDPIVDLSLCDGVVFTDEELAAGRPLPQYTLHALVTQEARGEIASVDLAADVVLDSQQLVPGYTFGAVGEIPTALVVEETNEPEYVFVASAGQLDIVARSIRWFLPEARRGLSDENCALDSARIDVGSAVTDLVLSPDGTRLYATIPERGSILEIPILACPELPFGTPREIMLSDVVPPALSVPDPSDYCLECTSMPCAGFTDPFDGYVPRDPMALGPAPRPVALAVDRTEGLLLVADARLPVVHVLDITAPAGATVLESLPLGVPSTDLVVTPPVPRTASDTVAEARFLYAIDAIERTVIAADYAVDPATRAPSVAVIPVDVRQGRAGDRIDVGSGARVLDVIVTNDYVLGAGNEVPPRTCPSAVGSTQLRGVFLAIGANDGGVHVVDVYDLDAQSCRFPIEMDMCAGEPGWVRRHRQRLATPPEGGISLTSAPTFTVGSVNHTVESDGTTMADQMLSLEAVPCPGQRSLFGGGVICGVSDPWATLPESWAASWEGVVPGTQGGRGRLVEEGDTWVLEGEVAFCDRGTLGALDTATLSAEAPEAGYVGDLLVVTAELPPRDPDAVPEGERAECERLFGYGEEDGAVELVDFPIVHAFNGRLELGAPRFPLPGTDNPASPLFGLGKEEVLATCFDELLTYEVRSQNAFTVVGGLSGFLHRVVTDGTPEGACVVDETSDPKHFSRAFVDRRFDNGIVTFKILPARMDGDVIVFPVRGLDVILAFTIGGTPARTSLPGGAIVNDLVYSPTDGRLYSADVGGVDGLGQFDLTPFARARTFQ